MSVEFVELSNTGLPREYELRIDGIDHGRITHAAKTMIEESLGVSLPDADKFTQDCLRTESRKGTTTLTPYQVLLLASAMRMSSLPNGMCIADLAKKNIFYGKDVSDKYVVSQSMLDKTPSRMIGEETMRIIHGVLGVISEAHELSDAIDSHIFGMKPLDCVNLGEEAGDIEWYLSILYDAIGESRRHVWQRNTHKLRVRYPEKFTEAHALNRDLDAERKELEKPC